MGLQRTVFAFHPTAAIKGVDEQGIPPFMKRDSAVNSRMINLRTKSEQCDNIDRKKFQSSDVLDKHFSGNCESL